MEEYIGWYIRKGVLAVERLIGQGAICIKAGDLFELQFHSRELPMCDTHSWGVYDKNDILIVGNSAIGRAVAEIYTRRGHYAQMCGRTLTQRFDLYDRETWPLLDNPRFNEIHFTEIYH